MKAFFAALSLKAKVIIACAAAVVVAGTAAGIVFALNREDSYRVLKVFEMNGESFVTRVGSGELKAYEGMNLESGDRLSVGAQSTLRVSLDGDKYILLDGGTVLELTAAGTSSDSRTVIKLLNGTILNELTNPLSANSSYEVATPKATMAVRGTSFTVSVEKTPDGEYIIRENTFDGRVEVELVDSVGNLTGESVVVEADKGVTILTEPNGETNNPAEIDGFSRFVYETSDNVFEEIPDGESPVHDILYDAIPRVIRETALRSNSSRLMVLDKEIVRKLSGDSGSESDTEPADTSAPHGSDASGEPAASGGTEPVTAAPDLPAPEPEITDATEGQPPVTERSLPAEGTTPLVTTVPATTVPESTVPPATTNVPSVTTTAPTDTTVPEGATSVAVLTTPTEPEPPEESCLVSFGVDGSVIAKITVKKGGTVPASDIPNIPQKTGYDGMWIWGGREFNSSTTVTSDIIVTAEYTPETYTVTFEGITEEYLVKYGETITLSGYTMPEAPTGYFWTVDGTEEFTGDTVIIADTNVRAEISSYTISYTGTDGNSGTVEAEYGSNLLEALADCDDLESNYDEYAWGYNGGADRVTEDITVTEDIDVVAVKLCKVRYCYYSDYSADWVSNFSSTVFPGETVPSDDQGYALALDSNLAAGFITTTDYLGELFTFDTVVENDMDVYEYRYIVNFTIESGEARTAYVDRHRGLNLLTILDTVYELPVGFAWTYTDASGNDIKVDDSVNIDADMVVKAVETFAVYYTDENGSYSSVYGLGTVKSILPPLPEEYNWYDETLMTVMDDEVITGDITVVAALAVTTDVFPDPVFRSYLSPTGAPILPYNITSITIEGSADAQYASLESLQGIGTFTSLTMLTVNDTSLKQIPVSELTKLTYLHFNQNPNINGVVDLTPMTQLQTLRCINNEMTGLKVPASVVSVICFSNKITSLDVSHCADLTELSCTSNLITSLNISNSNLTLLHCNTMPTLTSLTISCPKLTLANLNFTATGLTQVTITGSGLLISDIAALQAAYPGITFIYV